jgi:hypothetical protein
VADLDAAVLGAQSQVARAADDAAVVAQNGGERNLFAGRERVAEVRPPAVEPFTIQPRIERHQRPDLRILRRFPERFLVPRLDRLEGDEPTLEPLTQLRPHQRSSRR